MSVEEEKRKHINVSLTKPDMKQCYFKKYKNILPFH